MNRTDQVEASVHPISPIVQERMRKAEKIAAQLRVEILGEFADRMNAASNLDDARKMLADEIEAQRRIAGESKPRA